MKKKNTLRTIAITRFSIEGWLSNRRVTGTVRVISSDPPCKPGNYRSTTVSWKPLSDQVWIVNQCQTFRKVLAHFLFLRSNGKTCRNKSFRVGKTPILAIFLDLNKVSRIPLKNCAWSLVIFVLCMYGFCLFNSLL